MGVSIFPWSPPASLQFHSSRNLRSRIPAIRLDSKLHRSISRDPLSDFQWYTVVGLCVRSRARAQQQNVSLSLQIPHFQPTIDLSNTGFRQVAHGSFEAVYDQCVSTSRGAPWVPGTQVGCVRCATCVLRPVSYTTGTNEHYTRNDDLGAQCIDEPITKLTRPCNQIDKPLFSICGRVRFTR